MDNIEKALNLWVEITGIDPNSTSYTLKTIGVQQFNKELKESLVLDDTHMTTLMLLETFATEYLNERSFSVNEMIQDYDSVVEYLSKCKDLYAILQSEEIATKKADFKDWINEALHHYKVTNPAVFEMANSMEDLGYLRRDTLRSMDTLEIHQFSKGKPSNEPIKYVTEVHEFWNINSLIRALMNEQTLSGISLNLIRDPLDTASYFVIAIKNGENISILTDKPKYPHPLAKHFARRPGRDLSNRIERNHFPYGLLDIEIDRRGDAYINPKRTKELVIYQDELHPLKEIKDLEPDEIIWLVMLFSMIEEKFWKQKYQAEKISYTGEMVKNTLSIEAKQGELVTQTKNAVELPQLTIQDVSTDNMFHEWDMKPTRKHQWLEERYEDKIPNHILNLTGNNTTIPLLTTGTGLKELSLEEYEESKSIFNRDKKIGEELQKFDPTIFGEKESIVAQQRWVARYNKAVAIKVEVEKEFKEREKEIREWYLDKIKANQQIILHAVANGVFEAPSIYHKDGFGHEKDYKNSNILNVSLMKEDYYDRWGAFHFSKHEDYKHYCYLTGGNPVLVATIKPTTAEALARLCNCTIDELPDVLQHWNKSDLYSGNAILENIDPMEWVVKNPWKNVNFDIRVYLSKSGYNQIRKEAGLPDHKPWLEVKK